MAAFRPDSFQDRMQDRAKARQAEFDRAKKRAEAMQANAAARAEERTRIAKERSERIAAKEAARIAEMERIEAERKAAEEARIAAEEKARAEAEARQRAEDEKRAASLGVNADEIRKYAEILAAQTAYRNARKAARRA